MRLLRTFNSCSRLTALVGSSCSLARFVRSRCLDVDLTFTKTVQETRTSNFLMQDNCMPARNSVIVAHASCSSGAFQSSWSSTLIVLSACCVLFPVCYLVLDMEWIPGGHKFLHNGLQPYCYFSYSGLRNSNDQL